MKSSSERMLSSQKDESAPKAQEQSEQRELRFDSFKSDIHRLWKGLLEIKERELSGAPLLESDTARKEEIVQECIALTAQSEDSNKGAIEAFYQVVNPEKTVNLERWVGVEALERKAFTRSVKSLIKQNQREVSGVQASTAEDVATLRKMRFDR